MGLRWFVVWIGEERECYESWDVLWKWGVDESSFWKCVILYKYKHILFDIYLKACIGCLEIAYVLSWGSSKTRYQWDPFVGLLKC